MSRKKGFVIVVQQLYKWRYLPVAKVLFCDCERFADMLRNKSEATQMELMRSFWAATWLHLVDRIVADPQVSATSCSVLLCEKKPAQELACVADRQNRTIPAATQATQEYGGTWASIAESVSWNAWNNFSRVLVFSLGAMFRSSTFDHATNIMISHCLGWGCKLPINFKYELSQIKIWQQWEKCGLIAI